MAKQTYETKVTVPEKKPVEVVVAPSPAPVVDRCPVCKGTDVLVRKVGEIKTIMCQNPKCAYIANYKNGKII